MQNYNPYLEVFANNFESGFAYGRDYTNGSFTSQAFMAMKCAFDFDAPCAAYLVGSDPTLPGQTVLYGNSTQLMSQPDALIRNMAVYKYGYCVPGCTLRKMLMDPNMDGPYVYDWYPSNSDPTWACVPKYSMSREQIIQALNNQDPVLHLLLQQPEKFADILNSLMSNTPELAPIISSRAARSIRMTSCPMEF